jgi:hypothetical protein
MAHQIQCILCSFPYAGQRPHLPLLEQYHLLPIDGDDGREELLQALSRRGKCAYLETNYFGGAGTQIAETWENGERTMGPLISYDGIDNKTNQPEMTVVEAAINQVLRAMGIQEQGGMDEFDTLGLGRFRSNRKVLEAIRGQG